MPVQTKVKQTTLLNSENFIAPELHIGQKERMTIRSVLDVPSTEHQPPNKCIIKDESIVWTLYKLEKTMRRVALVLNRLLGISSTK